MNTCLAGLKLAALVLLCGVIVPLQSLILLVHKGRGAYILTRWWHKGVCKILGISAEIKGSAHISGQTIFMSNHISYLDIPLVGGIIKQASFIAKSDVQHWPVFGFLSKLQQTAFIERKTGAIKEEAEKLQSRVDRQQNLIIFPEGTSSDGLEVLPFKSSLFTLAARTNVFVQPVTITLLETDGKAPQTLQERRLYTWPLSDDTPLTTHLWRFACCKGAKVRITFHDVIPPSVYNDRKTLAKACFESVSIGLNI